MQTTRRHLLAATGALLAAPALLPGLTQGRAEAWADAPDPRMEPRIYGSPKAKTMVQEWFSFTCPHCANFAADIYPEIKAKLIDTGKIRYEFCEFPRDRIDLAAAMVARSLPPSRYEPFILALLASQQQWAFNRDADPMDELAKEAALAGMPRDQFDKVVNDDALKTALLAKQSAAEEKYSIDSTPTFIVNGKAHAGEMTFDEFAALAAAA
jgi:protein-disulfide isomerase